MTKHSLKSAKTFFIIAIVASIGTAKADQATNKEVIKINQKIGWIYFKDKQIKSSCSDSNFIKRYTFQLEVKKIDPEICEFHTEYLYAFQSKPFIVTSITDSAFAIKAKDEDISIMLQKCDVASTRKPLTTSEYINQHPTDPSEIEYQKKFLKNFGLFFVVGICLAATSIAIMHLTIGGTGAFGG